VRFSCAFNRTKELEVVFQTIFFGRPLGSAALKVPVLSARQRLEVVFQIIFWQAFSGSAALKRSYFQPNQGWRLFSDHILAGLFGLCSIKRLVLLSTEPGSWRLFFFQIIFWQASSGSAALKSTGPAFLNQGAGGCFQIIFWRIFGLCSVRVQSTFQPDRTGCFFFQIIFCLSAFRALPALKCRSCTAEPKGLEVFRSYFWQAFSGSTALKSTGPTQPNRVGGCFQIIFGRPNRVAALRSVPLSTRQELEVVFRSYFGRPFRALQH
jgi:hypothetical protein